MPIDLDSPDWDPSPSVLEELQSDPYTLPTAKSEQSDLPAVKLETVKDEPNEQVHHHQSSADVQPATVVTTQTSQNTPRSCTLSSQTFHHTPSMCGTLLDWSNQQTSTSIPFPHYQQ